MKSASRWFHYTVELPGIFAKCLSAYVLYHKSSFRNGVVLLSFRRLIKSQISATSIEAHYYQTLVTVMFNKVDQETIKNYKSLTKCIEIKNLSYANINT
jgi:hypothetical protein